MVVANVAVTSGWRVLWLVAAVAMPIRSLTAPAAPARTAASLTLNRSERKTDPMPSRSARRTSVSRSRGSAVAGQAVAAELGEVLAVARPRELAGELERVLVHVGDASNAAGHLSGAE